MRNVHVARLLTLGILLALGCHKTGTSSDSTNSGYNPSAASTASAAGSAGQSATSGSASSGNGMSSNAASSSGGQAAAAAPARPVVVPAGTSLTVTVDQDVSTKTNSSGDKFAASLAEPVTVGGGEVLPKGTKIRGTVTQSESAGHLKGGALLELTLDSMSVNGQRYSIETSSYSQQGKARGKRTVVGGGGGAALGAIVGAIAGGGKGAAIGAVAGGGAGTAGAAYTGDRDLTVPAETRVHFKLAKSVSISQ
jgi:hypothetical protein